MPDIDNGLDPTFRRAVRVSSSMLSVLLLAIWLAATQHCALEAAGLLDGHAGHEAPECCPSESDRGDACAHDGCLVVEGGSFTTANSTIKVPGPSMHACIIPLHEVLVPPIAEMSQAPGLTRGIEEARGWVPAWHFERRAAPPPRAPSENLA